MTDNFALLEEPRRPWIDPERLKEKFLAMSAHLHPDRVHQEPEAARGAAGRRYLELNGAYNCLREPKQRLRHLLELERGAKPADIQSIPPEMMGLFVEVGQLCRETDAFLAEKARAVPPILKAQMFERGQEYAGRLNAMRERIAGLYDGLMAELKTMNAAWESAGHRKEQGDRLPLERLEEIYRLLGYYGRWSGQIQERTVQLFL